MFSIAAINDTSSSRPRLETLPPTKEAQEARLAQTYQEALTELQAGNLTKAEDLFESILEDPIILQASCSTNENGAKSLDSSPMLQLRYSTLKNLAETLFKLDSKYHYKALDCYLQAAAIDQDDVVLWNRLGTLACSLGHFDIARAAFEQGLICSPRNWLCMEKLVELLIAIGDEEACRYTVKRLLKLSPSHSRARHIDDVLEGRADAREILRQRDYFNESLLKLNILPRGLDLLEPRHFSLSFPKKRRLEEEDEFQGSPKRSKIQTLDVKLQELSWRALLSSMIDLLQSFKGSTGVKSPESTSDQESKLSGSGSTLADPALVNALVAFSVLGKRFYNKPSSTEEAAAASPPETSFEHLVPAKFQDGQRSGDSGVGYVCIHGPQYLSNHPSSDSVDPVKGVDSMYEDVLPSHGRRCTRAERIRTRGYDRDDKQCSAKNKEPDKCEVLRQLLEPFIARIDLEDEKLQLDIKLSSESSSELGVDCGGDGSLNSGMSPIDVTAAGEQKMEQDLLAEEENDVQQFLEDHRINSGPYHVAHKLLETLALNRCKQEISVAKVLLLEKLTRQFSWKSRSQACSLYLAELSLDIFSMSSQRNAALFLSECDFHLCRVLEAAGLHAAFKTLGVDVTSEKANKSGESKSKQSSVQNEDAKTDTGMRDAVNRSEVIRQGHTGSKQYASGTLVQKQRGQHKVEIINRSKDEDWRLWLRYHWVNGRWHMHCGRQDKAREEFNTCLALMESRKRKGEFWLAAVVPHCKVNNVVNPVTVQRMLHELDIDKLLKESAAIMVEQGEYWKLIDLLVPVLLPSKDPNKGNLSWSESRRNAFDSSPEFDGLSILISACEKVSPPNLSLALRCYARRLEILCGVIGLGRKDGRRSSSFSRNNSSPGSSDSEQEPGKGSEEQRKLIYEEVKLVSKCAAMIRDRVDEAGGKIIAVQSSVLRQVQERLLDIICYDLKSLDIREPMGLSSSGPASLLDSSTFVDAFVAFCRLQHLDVNAPIKEQVDLLAAVHDVLAARGLCCAGEMCEGGEGAFLKLAIKHLGSIEYKLRLTVAQKISAVSSTDNSKESNSQGVEGDEKDDADRSPELVVSNKEDSREEPFNTEPGKGKRKKMAKSVKDEEAEEVERRRLEIGLDSVLDQCFFCLYGLNLRGGFEPSSHEGLTEHQNTNRGDYQTKEQCAGVFQYILPYAKACTRARLVKLRKVLRAVHKQFPYPPAKVLAEKAVERFLDDPNFPEEKFSEMVLSGKAPSETVRFAVKFHEAGGGEVNELCKHRLNTDTMLNGKQPDVSYVNKLEDVDMRDAGGHQEPTAATSAASLSRSQNSDCGPETEANCGDPYLEVYQNLYHFISEVEDITASDKWAGYVLTQEGGEFVEQNAKLLKYDLCYNPLRYESWYKLAKIYDEEVDLMLNDGSKNVNAVEWRKNNELTSRVEMSRRRTRRCLLMTLALAKLPEQQSEVHELLALVYYDSLQNVAPSYDQRSCIPRRDASWVSLCKKAMKHFEGAFEFKPDWKHLFYLGKLCEKLCRPCEEALAYYKQAIDMKSSAVDPVYRLHASRLKLLCEADREDMHVLQVIAEHCYVASTKEKVCSLLKRVVEGTGEDSATAPFGSIPGLENGNGPGNVTQAFSQRVSGPNDSSERKELILEIRKELLEDCMTVMRVCVEGELKHFHKARYRLAHGLYAHEIRDLDRAKEELAFCFRSSRSMFTINMWEIDGSLRKIRRKAAHATNLDVQMPESSRKFITCVRKYLILYLSLCEQNGDIYTLERAFTSLKVDKKFSLCLDDLSRLALRKYTQALSKQIGQAETNPNGSVTSSASSLLMEKLFNLFMDHGTSWPEPLEVTVAEAPVGSAPQASECLIHRHMHRYLYTLEKEMKLDILEQMNERIRKRFKSIKLLGFRTGEICRHACLAWCRALCLSLASITPLTQEKHTPYQLQSSSELIVDIQYDTFMASSYELPSSGEDSRDEISRETTEKIARSDTRDIFSGPVSVISLMKQMPVRQASVENLEKAASLLRSTYGFYRDSLAGPFPGGINLFLVQGSNTSGEGSSNGSLTNSKPVDISCPRKLLLWAFTLVHGRTGSVAEAVKYCEEQAKPRLKRAPVSGVLHTSASGVMINSHG